MNLQLCKRIQEDILSNGIQRLRVDDLTDADIPNIAWSGGPLHIKSVIRELGRVRVTRDAEYLAVRTADGQPIAIGAIDYGIDPAAGFLNQLSTHESLRGLGIGRLLIEEAERRIMRRGLQWARLAVEKTNQRAESLYRRLGYHRYSAGIQSWPELGSDGREFIYRTEVFLLEKQLIARHEVEP
jgi:ribosomal protein S18 acetylase RimI-like enzyme